MSQFSVVASLRVVSVIYSAELTGPRFHAIVYCQFPMQWFQTSWETGIITRLRRMSSAVSIAAYKCSVTLCYSVRRRPSVSFVIFRSSLGHILSVLRCYFVLFLQHYNFISRDSIFNVCSIDAVVLCVFCDSVLSLLYMCPFWIKRSGLVTPPGRAADPQFPTRPHRPISTQKRRTNLRTL